MRTGEIVTQQRKRLTRPIGHRNGDRVALLLALAERGLRRAQRRIGGECRIARQHFLRGGRRRHTEGRDGKDHRRKNRLGVCHRA